MTLYYKKIPVGVTFSGGASDYPDLNDLPQINGNTLIGNKTSEELGLLTERDVDEKIAELVGAAPETLDTIEEVAKALQDNENVVDALNNAIANKANKSELPTKTSDLVNDSGFITEADIPEVDVDLSNYYTKDETYSKAEVNGLFGSDGDDLLKVSPLTISGGTVDDIDGMLFEWLADSDGNEYSIGASVGATYTLEFEIDGAVMGKNALAMDGSAFGLPGQVVMLVENISSNEYNDIVISIQDVQAENKTLISYGRSVSVPYEVPSITIRSIRGSGSKYYTKAETEAYVQEQIANSITSVLNTEV